MSKFNKITGIKLISQNKYIKNEIKGPECTPYFTVRYNELIKPNFFTTNYNKIENMCMFYKSGLPYLCLSVDTVG